MQLQFVSGDNSVYAFSVRAAPGQVRLSDQSVTVGTGIGDRSRTVCKQHLKRSFHIKPRTHTFIRSAPICQGIKAWLLDDSGELFHRSLNLREEGVNER